MEVDLAERLRQVGQRRNQLEDRSRWLGSERSRAGEAAQGAAGQRDRTEAEVRAATAEHEELAERLSGLEGEQRRVESALGERRTALHECELRATEGRVRREELVQEARRTYGLEHETALRERHDPERDLPAARDRCAALAEKLQAIGPVNLVADEEYRELDERLSFLRTQHEDLTASIKDLEKALRGMTRTAQERFGQAFAEIGAHFQDIFARLLGGPRRAALGRSRGGGGSARHRGRADGATPRQETPGRHAHVGGGACPHGTRPALRDLLLPPESLLRPRRGGRSAGRRQHPPLPPRAARADQPDPVPRDHTQPQDHGGRRRALRRDHGGARALQDRLGEPSGLNARASGCSPGPQALVVAPGPPRGTASTAIAVRETCVRIR